MKWRVSSIAAVLFSYPALLFANANNDALFNCSQIQDNISRLACFDKLTAQEFNDADSSIEVNVAGDKPAIDLGKTWDNWQVNKEPLTLELTEKHTENIDIADLRSTYTPLSQSFDLDANHESGTFTIRSHKRVYLLPAWYNSKPNYRPETPNQPGTLQYSDRNKSLEAKMQLSFKTKLAEDLFKTRADLWFGYTQVSQWQVYNNQMSAPFRNTDYEPELFITQPVKANLPFGGQLRMLGLGINHQSNGQSDPLSRSWNRVIATAGMQWNDLSVMSKIWYRIPESDHKDDNPDLTDYMGHGEVQWNYRLSNRQSLGGTVRFNPKSGKGGMQFEYAFPINKRLRAYAQMYYGYGMNLLDYNHLHRSIGVGIMLNDWNGL